MFFLLSSGYPNVTYHEQQSLQRHHLGGGAESRAGEPVWEVEAFGDSGASDQSEEL